MATRNIPPNPATLNRRIQVWKKTKTTNAIGQTAYTDTLIRTVWAQLVPQSGSMTYQQTETVLSDVTHKVIIRYKSASDIAVGDHLMYGTRRFEIRFPLNPEESNWMIELYCQEVQDG